MKTLLRLVLVLTTMLQVAAFADTLEVVKVPVASVHRSADEHSERVTQVPLGDAVRVLETRGSWIKVQVPDQYRLAEGYPGWMLASTVAPGAPADSVTVIVTRATLRETPGGKAVASAFMGTHLHLTGTIKATWEEVQIPGTKSTGWLQAAEVSNGPLELHDGGEVIKKAQAFSGTPYLWGGISIDGIDCSGLTYIVYRLYGIQLPRDADQQFEVGEPVAERDLQPGDLVFYGKSEDHITHVGLYADNGKIVEASGQAGVRVSTLHHRRDYQGARRVIGVQLTMPTPSP